MASCKQVWFIFELLKTKNYKVDNRSIHLSEVLTS